MKKSERDKLRGAYYYKADQETKEGTLVGIDSLFDYIDQLENALKLTLNFCPKGIVPKGLDPTFYHTLKYDTDVKLQKRIDNIRKIIDKE